MTTKNKTPRLPISHASLIISVALLPLVVAVMVWAGLDTTAFVTISLALIPVVTRMIRR